MPTLPLHLIPAASPLTARAGFLPGSDVAAWLEEMTRHPGARFFIVPNSIEEADAGGLLIVPAGEGAASFGARVLPCGIEHGSVVVPGSLRLDPALTVDEARRLLPYGCYFFHPALGLVAFEEADAITPESLIVPPLPRETSWHQAMPGHTPPPRLSRIMLALPDEFSDLFGDAAQDIGARSPKDLAKNTPLLDRLKDKLIGGAAAVGLGGLAALVGLAKMLGAGSGGASRPVGPGGNPGKGGDANTRGISVLDRVMKWTADQMEKLAQKRERELDRLMKLLETNPELGLRYALPFSEGGDAARGQAPPSWQLGERNPIFGSRRGGGPADVWSLAPQTQWQLQQKYRDLANRELAAARYDRAAYIFAELLGDWHAAAGALTRGHRYQEAARLYLTKLNNKPLAAKCLEDGGLLTDALLLYGELAQHEKCGDLLRQLGREREAIAAFNEAIKGSTDRLHDARILFEKLQQHGLALSVLASGYPQSTQACQCLERHFDYLSRLAATPESLALARSLTDPARQLTDRVQMTETLRSIYQAQADPEVRHRISIVATSIIGGALAAGTGKEAALLAALPQFAASDLLLKRDAHRYADQREQARRQQRKATPTATTRQAMLALTHQGSLKLPQDGTHWNHLTSEGDQWLAIGHNHKTKQDVWVMGEGERIIGKLTSAAGWHYMTNLMPAIPPVPECVWLPFAKAGELERYGHARKADFTSGPNTREMLLDRLRWMPARVLAVHPQADGVWIAHHNVTETIDLSFYSYTGHLMRTHALGWAPPELAVPTCLAVHGDHVMLSAGPHLLHIKNGRIISQIELPARILRVQATKPVQPAAFLALTSTDAVLVAPGKRDDLDTIQLFSSAGGRTPKGCLLNDGRIAVGDESSTLIYSAYPDAKLISSVPLNHPEQARHCHPTSYAAWGTRHLAVLNWDGVIDWYG